MLNGSGRGRMASPAFEPLEGALASERRRMETRVMATVDMDSFYCSVERMRNPALRGVPLAVVQYNPRAPDELPADSNRIVPESNGSLIAVSYEAREQGVTRIMRAKEAKRQCPPLVLVQVPVRHSKADLGIYREAGERFVDTLSRFADKVKRASIDEAYVDLTEAATALARRVAAGTAALPGHGMQDPAQGGWSWVGGVAPSQPLSRAEVRNGHAPMSVVAPVAGPAPCPSDLALISRQHMADLREEERRKQELNQAAKAMAEQSDGVHAAVQWWGRPADSWRESEVLLACGAHIIHMARATIREELGFSCSAGIAHSLTLSKLASSMHKPDGQTIVPSACAEALLEAMPTGRVKGLGGDVGRRLADELGVETLGDLRRVPMHTLLSHFPTKNTAAPVRGSAPWLYRISRGIDLEKVEDRQRQQSFGAGKNFVKSKTGTLTDGKALRFWSLQLASQIAEQIETEETVHERIATKLVVQWSGIAAAHTYSTTKSRSCPITRPYSAERMAEDAASLVESDPSNAGGLAIGALSLSAGGLEDLPRNVTSLDALWHPEAAASTHGEPPGGGSPKPSPRSGSRKLKYARMAEGDVDPAILAELPRELREEFSRELAEASDSRVPAGPGAARPRKAQRAKARQIGAGKGKDFGSSGIAGYFQRARPGAARR